MPSKLEANTLSNKLLYFFREQPDIFLLVKLWLCSHNDEIRVLMVDFFVHFNYCFKLDLFISTKNEKSGDILVYGSYKWSS